MITLKKVLSIIQTKAKFVFVSVGANDGIFVDEVFQSNLLKIHWDCHFIEPVKERYDILIKNYEKFYPNNSFKYYNYAIHNNEGDDFLVTNKVDDSRGMCSFFRNETQETEKIKVSKKKFSSFLIDSNLTKIDFLKVDCEGMDFEIILQCFDNNIFPDLILYESINLNDNSVRGERDLIRFVESSDYVIYDDIPEFQYEDYNKLLIKKEFLNVI